MKKVFILSLVVMVVVATVFLGFIERPYGMAKAGSAQAMTLQSDEIVPLASGGANTNPSELVTHSVYTEDNEKICMLKSTGMLVTESGDPIMNPIDATVTMAQMDSQEYIDGANRKLLIYLDSFLDRHYLRSGTRKLTHINRDRDVFLINYRYPLPHSKGMEYAEKLVYAFRTKIDYGFSIIWNPGAWFNDVYQYFDMNGEPIDNENIVEWNSDSFARSMGGNLLYFSISPAAFFLTLMFGGADNFGVPYVKILEESTYGELKDELQFVTEHPYDVVPNIVTEDDSPIFLRPSTWQCVNNLNRPLYSMENGLPLVLYEGVLITTDLKQIEVTGGIARNIVTIDLLEENGTDYYVAVAPTPFGMFDCIVLNNSDDDTKPDWILPNGDSAQGVITPTGIWGADDNGNIFDDFFNGLLDWAWLIIAIVLVIFVGIPCLPLIVQLLKVFIMLIVAPFRLLARKIGGKH